MNAVQQAKDYLYSQYGDDPDMADLVEIFVADMPSKIDAFQRYTESSDWKALGTIAHQLKGSAGGYGFTQLTDPALRVETAVREDLGENEILESVQELVELCSRVRCGEAPW